MLRTDEAETPEQRGKLRKTSTTHENPQSFLLNFLPVSCEKACYLVA